MSTHPLSEEIKRISLEFPEVLRKHIIAVEETFYEDTLESRLIPAYAIIGEARLEAELTLFFNDKLDKTWSVDERKMIVDHFLEDDAKRALAKLAGFDSDRAAQFFSCAFYGLYNLCYTKGTDALCALFEPLLPYCETIINVSNKKGDVQNL